MEKKNQKQGITRDFIRSVGCNVFLLPVTLMMISGLLIYSFAFFKMYFFSEPTIAGEHFQPTNYLRDLIGLAIVIPTLVILFRALWRNTLLLYSIVTRYRTMRQEKARIDRLIKSEVVPSSQNEDLLHYAQDEAYKELANGKR